MRITTFFLVRLLLVSNGMYVIDETVSPPSEFVLC